MRIRFQGKKVREKKMFKFKKKAKKIFPEFQKCCNLQVLFYSILHVQYLKKYKFHLTPRFKVKIDLERIF